MSTQKSKSFLVHEQGAFEDETSYEGCMFGAAICHLYTIQCLNRGLSHIHIFYD